MEVIEKFEENGHLFLESVYSLEIIEKMNEEFRNFIKENEIYTHLRKRHDVPEEKFYVNNSYSSLDTYKKIQYYYLPVIDNRGCYNRTTDVGMIDFYNADKLFPNINKYFDIQIIISILKKITNKNWKLLRTNLQLCSNVQNSNSFHFDDTEKCIKFVIYLSDVLTLDAGPPMYIERTHNNKKNFKNVDIKTFFGKKGDCLISYQNGIHRKYPQNNQTVGFLVFNFIQQ
jgi:hypothetical protein